jgi:Ni,Fe-hydrogenase I large subunit
MIIKKLIEKIEGEAQLDFIMEKGVVEDVRISFGFYRGIEEILKGKAAHDTLVITPRVCGICNHAHLIAAVRALEEGYASTGIKIQLSDKAVKIREFTLACELIQNHIKWFYLVMLPHLEKFLGEKSGENYALKASYFTSTITKALAIFGGQWPHTSYAVPGGVTCDPTYVDVMQAETFVEESIRFFEQMVSGIPFEKYLLLNKVSDLHKIGGDFGRVLQLMGMHGMADTGYSHDRFITFGECLFFQSGKSMATTVSNIDVRYVEESRQEGTMAKAVCYKQRLYETGPLARAMVAKVPLIKSLHKRYKDSVLTRLFARVHEVALLLEESRKLLKSLQLDEPSCTLNSLPKMVTFEGVGVVEAARGSLIHKVRVKEGKIDHYDIIVPTQWNLSHGDEKERGIAVEAMVGAASTEEAAFIFRAFDICSVCTTQ